MRKGLALLIVAAVALPNAALAQTALQATLTGAAEVPGPGDPDGTGTATVTLDTAKGQACAMLHVDGIDPATMAHIHSGAAGAAGPVVVPLTAPATGMSEGCAPVAADVLATIAANPAGYYVNVHNAAFPKGAVRGQLGQ